MTLLSRFAADARLASGWSPDIRLRPRRRTPAGDDAEGAGCGWYESSRELQHGLAVIEWPVDETGRPDDGAAPGWGACPPAQAPHWPLGATLAVGPGAGAALAA